MATQTPILEPIGIPEVPTMVAFIQIVGYKIFGIIYWQQEVQEQTILETPTLLLDKVEPKQPISLGETWWYI